MNKDDVLRVAGEPALCVSGERMKRLNAGDMHVKAWLPPLTAVEDTALYTEAQLLKVYAAGAEDMRKRAANRCNKLAMKHHRDEGTYAAGKKFGAFECEGDIRALPVT